MPKRKILLVDDEVFFLEAIGPVVNAWGYEAIPVSTSKDALDKLKDTKIDAVVLDYKMPDMDGIELLKKIRSVNKEVPVIMFSAHSSDEALGKAKKLNVVAFIPKLSPYMDPSLNLKSALNMVFKKTKDGKGKS